MNWIRNFVKPRLKKLVNRDVPENLWDKCPSCEQMVFHRELKENLFVCPHCDHHMRLSAPERLNLLFDQQDYELLSTPQVLKDPLKFKDIKKYSDRHKDAKAKTNLDDAVLVAKGRVGSMPTVIAAMDFRFMGGSMGVAVGELLVKGAQEACRTKSAYIVVTASGGARMQEGILSLMQMARTTAALEQLKEANLPYLVVMTDPTSGGVTASFAMIGDLHFAEPGAMICFAGRRVIEQTIKQKLPDDFQTAEYLLEHGMVDRVIHRRDMKKELGSILELLMSSAAKPTEKGRLEKGRSR